MNHCVLYILFYGEKRVILDGKLKDAPPHFAPSTQTFHLDPIGVMRKSVGQSGKEMECK